MPVNETVLLAGLPLCLEGADSPVRDAMAALFACLPRLSPADETDETDETDKAAAPLRLGIHDLTPGEPLNKCLPAWLADAAEQAEADNEARLIRGPKHGRNNGAGSDCAALLVARESAVCALLSADGREIRVVARKNGASRAPLSLSAVIVPIFREIFARRGQALVHGAALRLPSGRALLLLADSGGGKSTTALALLRKGCRLLADDLTLLDNRHGARLRGIVEPLNLTPQTLAFFPELRDARDLPPGPVLPNGKRVLAADAVYAGAHFHGDCEPAALCVLRIAGDAPALRPLGLDAAFGRLLHAHAFARGERQNPAAAAACLAVLEAAPCFILETGPDPPRLGSWLMEALA